MVVTIILTFFTAFVMWINGWFYRSVSPNLEACHIAVKGEKLKSLGTDIPIVTYENAIVVYVWNKLQPDIDGRFSGIPLQEMPTGKVNERLFRIKKDPTQTITATDCR